jgi:phosphonate transport system substrate-binding protein
MTGRRFSPIAALAVVAALSLSACGKSAAAPDAGGFPSTVRVGLIPNVSPDEQRATYQPFGDYLEEELGVDVELFVAADYAGVVTALAADRIDIAYLGGLTYVQAEQQVDLTPIVTEVDRETGTPRYESAIVVREDSPHDSVEDLVDAGASFAFGDVASTSGSLYPRKMLVDAGAECSSSDIISCPPLGKITYSGGHDATSIAVHTGAVDAGGLELRILHRLEEEGVVPEGSLRVVETREVMGYPWVARTDLGTAAIQRIAKAFTSISDAALLDLMRAEKYVPVSPEDYDEIRTYADELGLAK